ncbi:MAG: hypothetical protein B7Y43_11535 [Sphingomonas sp. 28-62-20]|uniref:hypothetical protein n=1 Tax=Sphingomonas sp. 28-62-20 TaxID=1970433 RepID=UPI000BC83874|nr:MAG: hypothetical protein B7Y43_11535 [Sphingomonas sp. 28-62-20]
MSVSRKAVIASMQKLARNATTDVNASPGVAPDLRVDFANRGQLIESSQRAALSDDRFMTHVRSADKMRDEGNWVAAEAGYAAALSLYPYERSYWVQLAHMAKEQENFMRAEIAYRTACALGARPQDVVEHLQFVMARQNADEGRFPIRFYRPGPAAQQPPAQPDVALLAKLAWLVGGMDDQDMVKLLRTNATCDALLAMMIGDPRFERANRDWIELVREGEL